MAALMVGAALGAQQRDPAHPFPDHEPPDGWFCVPGRDAKDVATREHACACLGMVLDPVCGTPDENRNQQNSSKCKAWCRLDACRCGTSCSKDSN